MECTQKLKQKATYEGGREKATSADDCRRVSVGVSVQCKGYNLIGVTTVEVSRRGDTRALVLVYCLINSSLYTGTVQGWWSTPQLV
jgi:hypothetical protein